MIKVIRYIFFSFFLYFIYNKINKSDFFFILSNLKLFFKSLNFWTLVEILNYLILDNLGENSFLKGVSIPFKLDWKILSDTKSKKLFLIGMVFMVILNKWIYYVKKLILLPFKLGIFSFVYSVLGIDMSWFLSLFNIF